MINLYVPFANVEANSKLLTCARQWKQFAYDGDKYIPCVVICSDDSFSIAPLPTRRTKIYIVCYEADSGARLACSLSLKDTPTINTDELISRLLKSQLPRFGDVEIKLCVQQKKFANLLQITPQSISESLLKHDYVNPQLTIQVTYSREPFPGEIIKPAYYITSGSVPFFPNESEIDESKADASASFEPSKNQANF